ncbi:MAG: hypothetical protein ACRC6M_19595, partial [Microcystaceae cyanobacterium]
MTTNTMKRDVTIYQKSYQVPTIASVILEKLQQQMERHSDRLIQGKQVVQKKEQRGFLRTQIIEEIIQQPLTFQESIDELTLIQRDYNSILAILKSYQYDYQGFVQHLIEDIQSIVDTQVIGIVEKEEKRQNNEQQEFDKAAPNDQILALLMIMEQELLKITKVSIYCCILMIKKIDEITQNLAKIDSEQSPFLLEALAEFNKYKEVYQLTADMKAIRPQASLSQSNTIPLNLGKSVKSLMTNLKSRLAMIAQIDREISRGIGEINNIAHCLGSQQLNKLEPDLESQEITELLVTRNFNPERFQQLLPAGKPSQLPSWFDNTFEKEQQLIIHSGLIIKVLLERDLQRLALTALSSYLTPLPPLNTIIIELCLHNLQSFT